MMTKSLLRIYIIRTSGKEIRQNFFIILISLVDTFLFPARSKMMMTICGVGIKIKREATVVEWTMSSRSFISAEQVKYTIK